MTNPEEQNVALIPRNFIERGTFMGGMFKIRNAIEAVILYRLIHSHSYKMIEGTCTKREPAFFKNTQQILITDNMNQEYCFSLDKSVKLLQGHYYRLYFRKTIHPENTSNSYQDFLGFEELATIISDKT